MKFEERKKQFSAWLRRLWGALRENFRHFWHRFQLTRWLIVIFLSAFLLLSIYLTIIAKTANVKSLQSRLEHPTMVYDQNGNSAGSLYSQKGTYVKLNQISPNVSAAVLSTEDRNFYHEYGFSVKGLGRAAFLLVKNKVLGRNYISGGGSTLTQQLVKNAFLSQEQTFSRKAKEIFISVEVENQYSKNQILTMYLNNAYFGHGVWGIQDAAKRYFDTDAKDLTVPQAATLAGMLTSPGAYDPVNHPKATKARRNLVLDLMVENHKLTSQQAKRYQATSLVVSNGYQSPHTYRYPAYFDAVIAEAISKYGLSEAEVMNDGYKIYTTLNQGQQKAMQSVFNDDDNFPAGLADGSMVQAASVAVDPKTGGVTALYGGRGKHVFRGYNRATQMRRQPGSTIKPIAVYTPALMHGYFYDSTLQDEKTTYGTGKHRYTPKNYDDQYSSEVPMYKALYESLNAPAVWLLNKIGVNTGYKMAAQFGLPVESGDKNLALALGGLTKGVSPLQMARAYAVFASGGKLPTTHFITKIVDASGHQVKRKGHLTQKRIIKQSVANDMTSLMLDVFKYGTGKSAAPSGYTLAGKTGTTNSGIKENDSDRDKWIIGYTPDVVVATWEGYDDTTATQQLSDVENRDIYALYRSEMSDLLPHTAGTKFQVKDAQTRATSETKTPNGNLLQQASDFAQDIKDRLSQAWNNVRSLFQ